MPKDFSNPSTLKFMTENFEKETEKRVAWFIANQDKIQKAVQSREKSSSNLTPALIRKVEIENSLVSLVNHLQASTVNRRKKAIRDGRVLGLAAIKRSSFEPEPVMKPIDENVSCILRTSLPVGGRREYLKVRNRVKPEDRYNFCETSSSVYGWRLRDSKTVPGTKFGRTYTYHRGVRSRSGPQPDPSHYNEPPPASNLVCFANI
ncbi:hypothetical protein MSG28_012320 [Choristoneura fumiferana]|uniref:Uncharacterized protein n=1 Tax=Choristoneura fumiferana TaxID=7141 RepID=A0ACC0KD37_CHOFU|nr:hypothetical protein MSG28_012320 [Choristoneura fumiferana]